ncbi:MAG: phosphoribosylglycinamide formyltransferase [Alphaproteobacteria bacterium]|nr:phosphoribosylglycinamide formyltransferase [Alphaproteobacteria bacterium]MBU1524753.1 phosphoribosylglycinamide formyltransferase [Alphaproteobacteria bacterium]MBU2118585.1 phosphoribosylglycinamide formyltransferase [Alphaproteobacteria bacterium]MBU2351749.1 phosphoribosylglycinamide formyltransferase [Alphaproteobacteria bacterium]MBU2383421.1 phosphoribosylglycinamide formyltransferase [Alphaproteobacteria bacterium]
MSLPRVRVAVLTSGTGDNMAALIAAGRRDGAPYEVAAVVCNVPGASSLTRAADAGIEAIALDHRPFGKDREAHERALHAVLLDRQVEVVALAGYMRILTPWLVGAWEGRMLNIHPSLLPRHPGLNTHARALEAGDAEAGCTVHMVTAGVDEGPVLGQARVPVAAGDAPDTLAARVKVEELKLYPDVLARFCRDLRRA